MKNFKEIKDHSLKALSKGTTGASGLSELNDYFRQFGGINFKVEKKADKVIAYSTDFRYGSIITSGKNLTELDENIQDAILTSFDIPSAYAQEAEIQRVGASEVKYASA